MKDFDVEWERIKTNDESITTERANVLGGWLIRSHRLETVGNMEFETGVGIGMCMSYIPDLKHTWKLKK